LNERGASSGWQWNRRQPRHWVVRKRCRAEGTIVESCLNEELQRNRRLRGNCGEDARNNRRDNPQFSHRTLILSVRDRGFLGAQPTARERSACRLIMRSFTGGQVTFRLRWGYNSSCCDNSKYPL